MMGPPSNKKHKLEKFGLKQESSNNFISTAFGPSCSIKFDFSSNWSCSFNNNNNNNSNKSMNKSETDDIDMFGSNSDCDDSDGKEKERSASNDNIIDTNSNNNDNNTNEKKRKNKMKNDSTKFIPPQIAYYRPNTISEDLALSFLITLIFFLYWFIPVFC